MGALRAGPQEHPHQTQADLQAGRVEGGAGSFVRMRRSGRSMQFEYAEYAERADGVTLPNHEIRQARRIGDSSLISGPM